VRECQPLAIDMNQRKQYRSKQCEIHPKRGHLSVACLARKERELLIDLSHTLDADIPMFPGFPPPEVASFITREESHQFYADGVEFLIQRLTLIGNTGTYLDAPFHRYADGKDLADLDLARLCDVPGIMVDASRRCLAGQLEVPEDALPDDVAGCAVLFRTGWDTKWKTPAYLSANPYLTAPVAERLVSGGASVVGIDSWNADDVRDPRRPVHSILLAAGIPIIENLCRLGRLPSRGFRFHAPVLPVRMGTATPVRAYAVAGSD
jgi:arylformamidase